jgi:hypothetical protein
MRTTITLDEDTAAGLRRVMRERDITFKEAVNATLRAGLGTAREAARPYAQPVFSLGVRPGIDLDHALRLAAALDDEETVRKLRQRK